MQSRVHSSEADAEPASTAPSSSLTAQADATFSPSPLGLTAGRSSVQSSSRSLRRGLAALALLGASAWLVQAQGLADFFGDPPAGDPSALRPVDTSVEANRALADLLPVDEGALIGPGGEAIDPGLGGSLPEAQITGNKIPTGAYPSPLFGALPFTQPLLMFEEFGTEDWGSVSQTPRVDLPRPARGPAPAQDPVAAVRSSPLGSEIDAFLAQPGLAPLPLRESNTFDRNPWRDLAGDFIGRDLAKAPAEGRPPGEGWAHQRWNEFFPQSYLKTAQVGARPNNGMRSARQLHRFAVGEWGAGGLYHGQGSNAGTLVRFHPAMPVQNHNAVWTFDGTMPPKLLMLRYGQPLLMRHYNLLPIDAAANKGFGLHTITTHLHNGHNPGESDGPPQAFFFPGQYYDYRWPVQLAGYDSINTEAGNPRAAFPCVPGETLAVNDGKAPLLKPCQDGRINVRGDWREIASTHWFHDHMLDFTAQNVYKGNAAMVHYYSSIDRGNEAVDDGVNLRLPSGSALPWGNRDYDIDLLLADKAWDRQGQLWFNVFNKDGFLGDRLLTNWAYHPYLDVRARRYRFRLLNGAVARYFSVALVHERPAGQGELAGEPGSGVSYNRVPFHLIANDGNLMQHAVAFDGKADLDGNGNALEHKGTLPQQAIGERYEIVVDFAKHGIKPGDKLYFVNLQEHKAPVITAKRIPLADVLSGNYEPARLDGDDGRGNALRWVGGDPCVGKFMELRVQAYAGTDRSMDPADYVPGRKVMVPLKLDRNKDDAKLSTAIHRSFVFGHSGGSDEQPWTIKTDGGRAYTADPRRISAAPRLATGPTAGGAQVTEPPYEVWLMKLQGGWDHPIHTHFEEGIILRRGGKAPPTWETWARKDIFRIGPDEQAGDSVEVAYQFREFAGSYVEHCHATQHEDHAMLLRFDVDRPGQTLAMPTPIPEWEGVHYAPSVAIESYRRGDGVGPSYKPPKP